MGEWELRTCLPHLLNKCIEIAPTSQKKAKCFVPNERQAKPGTLLLGFNMKWKTNLKKTGTANPLSKFAPTRMLTATLI